jgi:hypothetical protein
VRIVKTINYPALKGGVLHPRFPIKDEDVADNIGGIRVKGKRGLCSCPGPVMFFPFVWFVKADHRSGVFFPALCLNRELLLNRGATGKKSRDPVNYRQ